MMVLFLYVPILLSLSISFLIHVFKKHIHLFLLDCVTTFNSTNTMTNHNYKLHPNSPPTIMHMHVPDSPPPPNQIGFIEDVGEGIEGLVTCTKSLASFQSIDVSGEIDDNDNNDDEEDEDNCWRKTRVAEGRGIFPPPLSSLNGNGQPSFILVPVRKNGRLQLTKVRIKRPKILYATRQDGRLRLLLVPDQCVEDNAQEEEHEQELVDDTEEEDMRLVESMGEEEEDDEVVEEIISYDSEEKDVRIGELKFPNERSRKCHEVLNHIQSHHHHGHGSHHHHLHMYGFSIA
ncbi:lateral signaling target protein 2 homolog [Glycine soja]|uniref:FAF domain-containing protein n=1 Tax=Glycine soja TaxID=3848 RepID=A0A445IN41_GLYSO|nr:lateral signaling target protein 2 homolog [Glycine soja]RZB87461.1 hypothetical protein D0Y65_027195 [Glycine soja]